MSVSRFCKLFIVLECLAFRGDLLFAQFESGTVLGTVRDPSGSAVTNAAVALENVKTGVTFQSKTDGNGDFEFVNERLGTYHVRVEAPGFRTATAEDFDLTVNARQRVD